MTDILLTTINARYIHASFGLRYLMANLGELEEHAEIREYTIRQSAEEIVLDIMSTNPKIVGLGVYIWNADIALEVAQRLKQQPVPPHLVLGGPEVSHEMDKQEICHLADVVIGGEADKAFPTVCHALLTGENVPHFMTAPLPHMHELRLPYYLYTADDLAHRVVYVEASRGCPFRCQFCLSSLDIPVRKPPLEQFLGEMQDLMDRGLKHFKFVDRTFNLSPSVSEAILDFFLQRYRPGMFLHFEMVPDRLPERLKSRILAFPPGALQFEVGIQTFNDEVAARIQRRQNIQKTAENLTFLRTQTGVHIHSDLIAGLPGETVQSFAAGFDQLVRLNPQEIQVGVLKRLRGTPIIQHDQNFQMRYSESPPYEIIQTKDMDEKELNHLKLFAVLWDKVANNGYFVKTLPLLLEQGTPFMTFSGFVRAFQATTTESYGWSLDEFEQAIFVYLTDHCHIESAQVASRLVADRMRLHRSIPKWLRQLAAPPAEYKHSVQRPIDIPARQARHLA